MAEFIIGKQCSVEGCQQLDFLPVECDKCELTFCRNHYAYESHSCKVYSQECSEAAMKVDKINYPCSNQGCEKKELVEISCPCCKLNFCLQHRHPQDHHCQQVETYRHGMTKTSQLVKDILKNTEKQITKKPKIMLSEKAKATAVKVSLMKIKQKAVGDAGLPAEQRVYLRIHHPPQSDLCMFFDKEWSVGKSIDVIADKFKVENKNNMSNCKMLCLVPDQQHHLLPSSKWNDLIKNNSIFSGSELTLTFI